MSSPSRDMNPSPSEVPICNPAQARARYAVVCRGDLTAAEDRSATTRMFDQEPPFTDEQITKAGLNGICNVNFGDAADALEKSMTAYVDLLQSVDTIATGEITYGTPEERTEWSREIFYEISRTIRAWPDHYLQFLLNSTYFVSQGVSFAVFPDEVDWRFEAARYGEIRIPKRTKASESSIPFFFWDKTYEGYELQEKIENKEMARELGWNVEAVEALLASEPDRKEADTTYDPERAAEDVKNNDYDASVRSEAYSLVHFFYRERSGKVSHHVFPKNPPKNGTGEDVFLFTKSERFNGVGSFLTAFIWGVGTNGHFDNIRGLGDKLYPLIQILNRLTGAVVDGSAMSSRLLLQPKNEGGVQYAALTNRGAYAVLHPNVEVVERGLPNFAGQAMPAVGMVREQVRGKMGSHTAHDALPTTREMSRFEVSARLEEAASLSVTALTLFYTQYDKLIREMVRRLANPDYVSSYPGGEEVAALKRRLEARGVPLEAFYSIDLDTVVATRAVGAGSPGYRNAVFGELTSMAPGYDEVGRQHLLRDRTAAVTGSYQVADRYAPRVNMPRQPMDYKIALLENYVLMKGEMIEVTNAELHLSHLKAHVPEIDRVTQEVDEGVVDILDVVPGLVAMHQHSVDHMERLAGDPVAEQDIAMFRQKLQQIGEYVMNGMRELAKIQREGGGQEGQAQGAPDPLMEAKKAEQDLRLQKMQVDLATAQAKLQVLMDKHQTEKEVRMARAASDAAIREAEAAARLRPAAPSMGRSLSTFP